MKISVAPRSFSSSITNEPRKPPPPVTITRLSFQKSSAIFLQLLHNKLCVSIPVVHRVFDQARLQCKQNFADPIVYIQSCVKSQHSFDLFKRYSDITHITAKRHILIFDSSLRDALQNQIHDLVFGIVAVIGSNIENLSAHFLFICLQTHDNPMHHILYLAELSR